MDNTLLLFLLACGTGALISLFTIAENIFKNSEYYEEKRRRNLQKKFTIIKGGKR